MITITTDYLVLFGAVSVIFGMMGYIRAKSLPSLVMGGIFGLGLVASAVMILRSQRALDASPVTGLIVGLVLSVLLLGRFLPAFLKSKSIYPSGIMALLALGGAVLTVITLIQPRQ